MNPVKRILALFLMEMQVIIHFYQLAAIVAVLGEPLATSVAVG